MEMQSLQIVAGSISSFLFISGNIPMLVKAFRSRNIRSYSLSVELGLLLSTASSSPIPNYSMAGSNCGSLY
jgi:hypothetical protein